MSEPCIAANIALTWSARVGGECTTCAPHCGPLICQVLHALCHLAELILPRSTPRLRFVFQVVLGLNNADMWPMRHMQMRCYWKLDAAQESLITSVVFGGTMLGAYSWGWLSDAKGRRVGFFGTAMFTFLFGILSALAPNYQVPLIPFMQCCWHMPADCSLWGFEWQGGYCLGTPQATLAACKTFPSRVQLKVQTFG